MHRGPPRIPRSFEISFRPPVAPPVRLQVPHPQLCRLEGKYSDATLRKNTQLVRDIEEKSSRRPALSRISLR